MPADWWGEQLLQVSCGEEKPFKHEGLSNWFPANYNYWADQDGRLGSQRESCSEQRWHPASEGNMAGLWHAPLRLSVNTRALLSAPPYLPAVLHVTHVQEDEQSVVVPLSHFRNRWKAWHYFERGWYLSCKYYQSTWQWQQSPASSISKFLLPGSKG